MVVKHRLLWVKELSWKEDEMIRAVLSLRHDVRFQSSLFNRRAMPMTFGLFDQAEELGDLSDAMVGYDRR